MSVQEFDADSYINTRGCILGRVASEVAARALDGERIAVVNAESAIVTGDRDDVFAKYKKRTQLGSDRGPHYPKRPDRIMKRSVRGMVPHTRPRGQEALDRVRVYVGNPFEEDGETIEGTSLDRLSSIRFVELGEICDHLGANVTW